MMNKLTTMCQPFKYTPLTLQVTLLFIPTYKYNVVFTKILIYLCKMRGYPLKAIFFKKNSVTDYVSVETDIFTSTLTKTFLNCASSISNSLLLF